MKKGSFCRFTKKTLTYYHIRTWTAFRIGLIRVDHLVYPPLTRPLGPLPDPYPNPGGYLIPRAPKRMKNNEFELKSLNFLSHKEHLKVLALYLFVSSSILIYWLNRNWQIKYQLQSFHLQGKSLMVKETQMFPNWDFKWLLWFYSFRYFSSK